MKIRTLHILLFIFAAGLMPAQDTITVYYNKEGMETTDKSLAAYYRKAVMDNNGAWAAHDYFMNNIQRMTGTYSSKKLNSRQGRFVYFYESGKKKAEGKTNNNKKEGVWLYWHENGKKQSDGKYVADKCEDTWTYWHENGEKKSEGNYLNNQRVGTWKFWNEKGEFETEEYYKGGKVFAMTWFYDNGMKKAQGAVADKKKINEWTYWNIDGRVYLKGNYLNGEQNGEWVRYFENGESATIYYENGVVKNKLVGGILKNE